MSTRARLAALGPARAFLSRELSWLGFARRVLHLVGRADLPLLERVKFAGIIGMLHDEFFMKRMSGLKREMDNRAKKLSIDGRTPADELAACRVQLLAQVAELGRLWHEELVPDLVRAGLPILRHDDLKRDERAALRAYFARNIQPILTPSPSIRSIRFRSSATSGSISRCSFRTTATPASCASRCPATARGGSPWTTAPAWCPSSR